MTAPAVQRGRIPRLPDDYTRAAAAQRLDFLVLCGEISLGSAAVAEEWVDAHERFGRNRP